MARATRLPVEGIPVGLAIAAIMVVADEEGTTAPVMVVADIKTTTTTTLIIKLLRAPSQTTLKYAQQTRNELS